MRIALRMFFHSNFNLTLKNQKQKKVEVKVLLRWIIMSINQFSVKIFLKTLTKNSPAEKILNTNLRYFMIQNYLSE